MKQQHFKEQPKELNHHIDLSHLPHRQRMYFEGALPLHYSKHKNGTNRSIKLFSTFRIGILPVLKRIIKKYHTSNSIDFRILLKIQDELTWHCPNITDEQLTEARNYFHSKKIKIK